MYSASVCVTMIDRQTRGTWSCRPFANILYTRQFFETVISPEPTSSELCPTTGDLGETVMINCFIRFPDWHNIITCTTVYVMIPRNFFFRSEKKLWSHFIILLSTRVFPTTNIYTVYTGWFFRRRTLVISTSILHNCCCLDERRIVD